MQSTNALTHLISLTALAHELSARLATEDALDAQDDPTPEHQRRAANMLAALNARYRHTALSDTVYELLVTMAHHPATRFSDPDDQLLLALAHAAGTDRESAAHTLVAVHREATPPV